MTSKLYYAPSPTITIKPKPATTITRAAVQEAVAAVASGQSPAQRAIEELLKRWGLFQTACTQCSTQAGVDEE